jgi:hypothetical protein
MNMTKSKIVYEEESVLIAKYYHPKSDDYLDYKTKIVIKDSGKTPIQMNLTFDGILPFAAPMPPKEHTIRAKSILDLSVKIKRWLKKYGYELI